MKNKRPPSKHGTHTRYSKGCRCEACRAGHRAYERQRKREIRREQQGIEPRRHRFVDTTEVRNHINFLRSKGIGYVGIAKRSGVDKSALQQITRGEKKKMLAVNASRILAIPAIPNLPGQYVPSDEARRLVAELRANGYFLREINAKLGNKTGNLSFDRLIRAKRLNAIRMVHADLMRQVKR